MKKLIYRGGLFCLGLVVVLALPYFLIDVLMSEQMESIYRQNSNVRIVFAGDSSIVFGVNDTIIPHALNIGKAGESYLYTYCKLKVILDHNPQVKAVVLSFSPYSLDRGWEHWTLFRESVIMANLPQYYYLLSDVEKKLIFWHNPKAFILSIPLAGRKNCELLMRRWKSPGLGLKDIDQGGYERRDWNEVEKDKVRKAKEKTVAFEKGDIQLQYLRMISQMCRQKKVKLVLLNPPKHPFYIQHYFNQQAMVFWQIISREMIDNVIMDCSGYSVPDSFRGDLLHLNTKGADVFSRYLADEMTRKCILDFP